jgi:cytochrome c-type biogenesis protein CcmH/NrfG
MVLSWATYAVGKADESKVLAADAASALEETGANRQAAAAWTELAELSAQIGDSSAALEAYRRATQLMGIAAQRPTTSAAGYETRERAAG